MVSSGFNANVPSDGALSPIFQNQWTLHTCRRSHPSTSPKASDHAYSPTTRPTPPGFRGAELQDDHIAVLHHFSEAPKVSELSAGPSFSPEPLLADALMSGVPRHIENYSTFETDMDAVAIRVSRGVLPNHAIGRDHRHLFRIALEGFRNLRSGGSPGPVAL